jgi:uncharacterized protein YceK
MKALFIAITALIAITGCTQIVTAPISVAGSVAGATIKVAGAAGGAVVNTVTGGSNN